MAEAPWISLG